MSRLEIQRHDALPHRQRAERMHAQHAVGRTFAQRDDARLARRQLRGPALGIG